MLKKFSVTAFPFVRKFISFAQIAMGMCYYQIVRAIRAAFGDRHHVIDMEIVRIERLSAPITYTLLALVLSFYIVYGVNAADRVLFRASPSGPNAVFLLIGSIVGSVVLSLIRPQMFSIGFSIRRVLLQNLIAVRLVILSVFFLIVILLSLIAALLSSTNLLRVPLSIVLVYQSLAGFTVWRMTKPLVAGIFRREFRGFAFGAINQNIRKIDHLAPLCASSLMSSAGGESSRCSVANLADQHIIPQGAVK